MFLNKEERGIVSKEFPFYVEMNNVPNMKDNMMQSNFSGCPWIALLLSYGRTLP